MFGSAMLEVAIGIVFVYVLISIICSAVREGIEAWLKTRAAYLEYGIRELLHDKDASGLARSFFNHPLVFSLYSGEYKPGGSKRPAPWASGANLPSYIPAKNFALTLMDIAARGPTTDAVSSDPSAPAVSLATVRASVLNLHNPAVQRVMLAAIDSAQGDFDRAQASLEAWYDSVMDRVSGWYKRSTQWVIFWIALIIVIGGNVNTIAIADYLYRNDAVRGAIVARAESAATDAAFLDRTYQQVTQDLDSLHLPIGWTNGWGALGSREGSGENDRAQIEIWNDVFAPVLGWLLTAFAATLGAPFWFDVLNKVMVIRATVKPHEKSPEESSEDRQLAGRETNRLHAERAAVGGRANAAVGAGSLRVSKSSVAPRDADSNIDGCDVTTIEEVTPDERLPPAEGGVA